MPDYTSAKVARRLALTAAGALGLMLAASPAPAQDYGRSSGYYNNGPPEEVDVVAPRYRPRHSSLGAPIVDVSLSREVRIDDLDLRSAWGAHELRARIRDAARDLCSKLDFRYPIAIDDSPPCYRTAVEGAMAQAYAAIDRARGYADAR